LQFSADGQRLFAAGDTKQVDVWVKQNGRFVREHRDSLRPPIGPGPTGVLRAMDVSADDRFVIVGGIGVFDDLAGFRTNGILIRSSGFDKNMLAQLGALNLFDRQQGTRQTIASHFGYVLAIDFIEPLTDEQNTESSSLVAVVGNDEAPAECDGTLDNDAALKRSLKIIRTDTGEIIASWEIPDSGLQPEVRAWMQTPGQFDSIVVAVTTGNGVNGGLVIFRYGQPQPTRLADPFAIATAGPLSDQTLLVTTRHGLRRLRLPSGDLHSEMNFSQQFAAREVVFELSAPATGLRNQSKNAENVVAITTRDLQNPAGGHRLRVVDLATQRLIGPSVDLGTRQNPIVAVDPSGQTIAATADVSTGLRIYRVSDLRAGVTAPFQNIGGDFLPIQRAALARDSEGKTGLRLERQTHQAGQTERLDLIDGRLRRVPNEAWRSFGTKIPFRRVDEKITLDSNFRDNGQPLKIPELETTSLPLGVALRLPFLNDRLVGAIAYVASVGEATPRLILVDLATGETLRELNGHDQFIHSIEFSLSGRRLTTVSGDGMVCVWALDDLTQLVGRRGTLLRTEFCKSEQSLVVTKTDSTEQSSTPNDSPLQIGDAVLGIMQVQAAGKEPVLQKFDSVYRLLEAMSVNAVGEDVVLRVLRQGQQIDATVRLGQATDERKPLVSVVLASAPQGDLPDWMAWSPHGPFDASNESIQERAGWHFNSSAGDEMNQFSPLSEYREKFFGRGLLNSLLANGRVPEVWPPTSVPDAFGVLRGEDGEDIYADGRHFLLPGGRLSSLQFLVENVPASAVESATVQIDDGPVVLLERSPSDPNIWEHQTDTTLAQDRTHLLVFTLNSGQIENGRWSDQWQIDVPKASVDAIDLPEIRLTSHATRSLVMTPAKNSNNTNIEFAASIATQTIDPQWEIKLEVDGQYLAFSESQMEGSNWRGQADIPLGRHFIAVVLDDGKQTSRSDTVLIEHCNPPVIESFAVAMSPSQLGMANLVVRSREPLDQKNVNIFVESMRFDGLLIQVRKQPGSDELYDVTIDEIPLSEGENEIECRITDGSGHSRATAKDKLDFDPTADQPQLLVSLAESVAVQLAEIPIEIKNNGENSVELSITVGGQPVPLGDSVRLAPRSPAVSVSVPLQFGNNRIRISATGERGEASFSVHDVVRIEAPLDLLIDQITTANDQVIAVRQSGGSWICEQPVDNSSVRVQGRIRLSSRADGERLIPVQGWVNGFLQNSVESRLADDGTFVFNMPLRLTAAESTISFEFPELPEAESKPSLLSVRCSTPDTNQTLHLIVVSTEVADVDRESLEENVLKTFTSGEPGKFAFREVRCGRPHYFAATGQVRSGSIRSLMRRCYMQTNTRSLTNHVVMFYFQGSEIRDSDGTFGLVTDDVLDRLLEDRATITSDYLAAEFRRIRGAHIVLLDVQSHPLSAAVNGAGDPNNPDLGVLRMGRREVAGSEHSTTLLEQIKTHLPQVEKLVDLANAMRQQPPDQRVVFEHFVPDNIGYIRLNALAAP
jgi:hypothetical protein